MARVLIVDDSAFQRRAVATALSAERHEILEAETGDRAIARFAELAPDCVVTDLIMPGLNGAEYIRKLREVAGDTPIVVLSADIQETQRAECYRAGVQAFLNKPLNKAQLTATVAEALGGRGGAGHETSS